MRPVVLLLVYGVLLVIIGATAAGQAALVSSQSQTSILNTTVNADAAIVRTYLDYAAVTPADLTDDVSSARAATLSDGLEAMVERGGILHAALLTANGTVVAGSDRSSIGRQVPMTEGLRSAITDQSVDASIQPRNVAGAATELSSDAVLREYLPIIGDGQAHGAVAIWRDAVPILVELEANRLQVVLITLTAAVIAAFLLYYIFRSAQLRLTRQTVQLLEGARRDPLTGALNHGAVVESLATTMSIADSSATAPAGAATIGVALIDIDNFGGLNDTYGHAAGDRALVEVATLIGRVLPADATWGRYGPDEFLVVARGSEATRLEPSLDLLRAMLADVSLTFDTSERLPITLSAGICYFPTNGESVTTLLSVLAETLDEAKASGGDTTLVADARPRGPSYAKTFDVLEGLIIAVDTKDRYTRRHSEDVARYADFMAELMGLDRDTRAALRAAGLLHDIGKIGIPDTILRKPGALTDEEYAIVQQHVALGDMIVRDLPNLELIRDGIRHHHERWDGKGYLHRLEGEEIPLIARILAVGDAFSAMTTTRPYRKAMSVDEALTRLEDAAGTQLDADIAIGFVNGIRTAADPPLPDSRPEPRIWTPDMRVA